MTSFSLNSYESVCQKAAEFVSTVVTATATDTDTEFNEDTYKLQLRAERMNMQSISGGARVFAARGKRLCCRPPPHPVAYLEI